MTAENYAKDLVKRFGKAKAIASTDEAIKHHLIQYQYHKHPKCLSTLHFFKNVLEKIC